MASSASPTSIMPSPVWMNGRFFCVSRLPIGGSSASPSAIPAGFLKAPRIAW